MNSILVVDDEKSIQSLLVDEFELEGFEVKAAASGNTAIALLEAGFKPDIVLTDMKMPDGNGIDLLRYLNSRKDLNPIVFVLSAFLDTMQNEVHQYKVDGIISKPYNRESLFNLIQSSLKNRKK